MNEPAARLMYLFPGVSTFPNVLKDVDERSRLCEVQWVERALFGNRIVAVSQTFHSATSAVLGREIKPGMLGEQLVFSDPVHGYDTIQVGDAVFRVVGISDLTALGPALDTTQPELWTRELELVEEGLVEPGSPVVGF